MASRVASIAESPAANFDSLPDSAHVGSNVVRALYGVRSLVTLWKWERAGRIPRSRKLAGSRNNSWNVGDLRAALAAGGA
jgi:hypothetical protein